MRSSWIRVGAESNDKSPYKRHPEDKTHDSPGRDWGDAATRDAWATRSWRRRGGPSPEPPEGAQPRLYLHLKLLASRPGREQFSVVLSP